MATPMGEFTAGGYRAVAPLAVGGSARIWRGEEISTGRPVALKVFPAQDAPRARREAALATAADHPHVLAVLEVVMTNDRAVLVTPLAAGGSLAELLSRRGPLNQGETLTVLIPLADALAAAHERDILHGDISAANVLFDGDGRPLLADLGAARAAAELSAPVAVTATDVAPEVARGAPPTAAGDLFSLGSVALRCLTGRPAWPADDLHDVLVQSTAGQWPDPPDGVGSPVLLRIVRRLLEADPALRGSAGALAVGLRGLGRPEPVDLALAERREPTQPVAPGSVTRLRIDAVPRARVGRSRRRRSFPTWRHAPRRAESGGRHALAERQRGRGRIRPRAARGLRMALVATGALAVVATAVLGGLWWADRGRDEPMAVAAVVQVTSSTLPRATGEPGGTLGASAVTAGADVLAGDGPTADGPTADWKAVINELDGRRAHALVTRDPDLLTRVYTADSTALDSDVRLIGAMTSADYHVAGATHRIDDVSVVQGADSGAGVQVRVLESLPAYSIRSATGEMVGSSAPSALTSVVMLLVPTDDGYRISDVRPG